MVASDIDKPLSSKEMKLPDASFTITTVCKGELHKSCKDSQALDGP